METILLANSGIQFIETGLKITKERREEKIEFAERLEGEEISLIECFRAGGKVWTSPFSRSPVKHKCRY